MTRKRIYNLAFFLAIGIIFGLLIKYFTHFTWDFKVSAFDAFQKTPLKKGVRKTY